MDSNTHVSALYSRFARPILKLLLKRNGGDIQAAESVLQDTFVSAFKSYHTFKHKSSYFTWLCKIALNKLADYYRDQVHYRSKVIVPAIGVFNSIIDPGITPEERLSLEELCSSVNQSLDLLPPEYRQLLQLKYYQQLSSKDICLKLHLTPRQLEGRLYRARHALAKVVSSVNSDYKL